MGDFIDTFLSARTLAAAIRSKEVSPLELLDACLARVDAVNGPINAVIWRNDEEARAAARAATEAVSRSDPADLPPFHGIPIPIKDLTPVAGWPVTYGSRAAPEGTSAEGELIVEAFRRAGFVLAGRTNTPEFGPLTVSENDRYGITRNPWNLDHTPGGSSGGAGAAAAAGMFPLAHGNDGGGSIRIPGSCCGLVGLKVSRGRVPRRYNSWEGGSVEGVLTHDVADTAAVLDVISGPDLRQWYNAPAPERPFLDEVGADPGRLRVGILEKAPMGLPMDESCAEAARQAGMILEKLGHHVETVSFEIPDEFIAAFLKVVSSGLADYEGVEWERAEPHVRAARANAQSVDSLEYVHSVHQLQLFTRDVVNRWVGGELDILLGPTMTIEPPRAGEVISAVHEAGDAGPQLQVLQMAVLTSAFNMTGQPAISLPTYHSPTGLPVGIQLVAGPWEEALLLRVAAQIEQSLPWAGRRPVL